MSKQIDALKLALEALEYMNVTAEHHVDNRIPEAAITAIKEALAQPAVTESHKQEPVAWMQDTTCGLYVIDHPDEWHCIPLYTTPLQRTWAGLTEEEVIDLWPDLIMHRHTYKFWQNLEAKLKEKNT